MAKMDNYEERYMLEEVQRIIRSIGIYEWLDYDNRISKLIGIDLNQEEEVKRLKELAEKIGLCPVCICSGKVMFLKHYDDVYGCSSCHYREASEEERKSIEETIKKAQGFIKL